MGCTSNKIALESINDLKSSVLKRVLYYAYNQIDKLEHENNELKARLTKLEANQICKENIMTLKEKVHINYMQTLKIAEQRDTIMQKISVVRTNVKRLKNELRFRRSFADALCSNSSGTLIPNEPNKNTLNKVVNISTNIQSVRDLANGEQALNEVGCTVIYTHMLECRQPKVINEQR